MTVFNVSRFVLLWVLALGVALVSYRFFAGVELTMPHMLYHSMDRPLAFYAHVSLAPVALALVPFQFWSRLRTRRPGLHRWTGRLYAVAILIAGIGGFVMALQTEAGSVAGTGFMILSILWLGVTANAVRLAMQRRISEHRDWMVRSAALTLAAVTLRLYLPGLAMGFGFDLGYTIVAWACWVPNVIIAEWLIRRDTAPVATPA